MRRPTSAAEPSNVAAEDTNFQSDPDILLMEAHWEKDESRKGSEWTQLHNRLMICFMHCCCWYYCWWCVPCQNEEEQPKETSKFSKWQTNYYLWMHRLAGMTFKFLSLLIPNLMLLLILNCFLYTTFIKLVWIQLSLFWIGVPFVLLFVTEQRELTFFIA